MDGYNESVAMTMFGIMMRTLFNVLIIFGLIEGFIYSYHFSYSLFADIPYKPTANETRTITIDMDTSAKDIAQLMEDSELVDSRYIFLARLYLGRYSDKVKAGTYTLSPSMSPDNICRNICGIQSGE